MVNIYLFFFTNTNNQTPNDTAVKMHSTLDPSINIEKLEEEGTLILKIILQKEFQRCHKWISGKQLQLVSINLIHFNYILKYYIV